MLELVKAALRLTNDAHDDVVSNLIDSAYADLELVGIDAHASAPLVVRAVVTYCRANFSSPSDYDRLKASYDEQKAQLLTASGYGLHDGGEPLDL